MTLCRICDATTESVFDLGMHPLADRFVPAAALETEDKRHPLVVETCSRCHYVGLSHVVSETDRYQDGEYSYTSGNSPVSIAHFQDLAKQIEFRAIAGLVVDIGGNDGTLLRAIERHPRLNVEPSSAGAIAAAQGIETHVGFWDEDVVLKVWARGGAAAIVMCNAFNHVSDPDRFLSRVAQALRPGGIFVIETPSLAELVKREAWDTIYLEHVSYWSLSSLVPLLARYGLHVFRASTNGYMGGSLRVWAGFGNATGADIHQQMTADLWASHPESWRYLAAKATMRRADVLQRLVAIDAAGGKVVAVGAAAKGNTFLNFCGIGPELVSCVLDTSPHKIGKRTPGSRIPIVAESECPKDATHGLILPWNIAEHLKSKLAHLKLEWV